MFDRTRYISAGPCCQVGIGRVEKRDKKSSAEEQYHQQDISKYSFCKKHNTLSVALYRTILYLLHEFLFPSQKQEYESLIEVNGGWFLSLTFLVIK